MSWNLSQSKDWGIVAVSLRSNSVLPIELISFNAKNIDNNIELNWSTLAEINNNYFSVERSNNSLEFEVISQIKGLGNSNSCESRVEIS